MYGNGDVSNPYTATVSEPAKVGVLKEILAENGNNKCADCGMLLTMESASAVLSYGIFVCDDCKLVHIEEDCQFLAKEQNDGTRPEGALE